MLAARKRGAPRASACTEDELARLEPRSVPQDDGVLVNKAGLAYAEVDGYARALQYIPEALLAVEPVDRLAHARLQLCQIWPGRLAYQPVLVKVLRFSHQARRLGEDAGRRTTVVRAVPAQAVLLDQRDRGAQLTRTQRGGDAGRTSADYDHIVHPAHLRSLYLWSRSRSPVHAGLVSPGARPTHSMAGLRMMRSHPSPDLRAGYCGSPGTSWLGHSAS